MPNPLEDPDVLLIQTYIEKEDHQSFNLLLGKYQDQVHNFCYRFFGNESDAEDCSQEIFIKVFQSIKQFKFRAKFSSWLYRICFNTCYEMVRSKAYRQRKSRVGTDLSRDNIPFNRVSGPKDFNPEIVLQRKQMEQAFQEALSTLKAVHRTMIILRDIEGRSYEEIAGITGMKTGTVRSSLARARYKMAGQLKEFRNAM